MKPHIKYNLKMAVPTLFIRVPIVSVVLLMIKIGEVGEWLSDNLSNKLPGLKEERDFPKGKV